VTATHGSPSQAVPLGDPDPAAKGAPPRLILGPLLRYVGTTQATVWVETDAACEVAVLGARKRTFCVEGHHYALVAVDGLTPGTATPYDVRLDGHRVWPPAGDERPPCRIATRQRERQARLVFGSCRVGAPHREPYTRPPEEDPEGFGIDALWAYSRRLQREDEPWPDCLLLLGDQVYADEVSPETAEYIGGRVDEAAATGRPGAPPEGEVANFEEYTRLHRESWSDPDIRWLLSTVPSTMIWDDHDVHDDWNISAAWVSDMRKLPWWEERVAGAYMAYWVYQHIGNLAPPEFGDEPLLEQVYEDDDAGPRLRRFALAADADTTSARFAFHRDFGRSRLIVIDTRAARVLTPGRRDIVDEEEWRWIAERAHGDFDHLILASTVPVLTAKGIHHVEAWSERVCAGAWGGLAARVGERLRRELDLEHWPAFQRSFRAIVELIRERASSADPDAPAPATILLLGGDVHTAYVAEATVADGQRSRIYQIVCSPFRKPLNARERRVMRILFSRPAAIVTRGLAAAAGVRAPAISWRLVSGPTFHNSIGLVDVDGRDARVSIRRSGGADHDAPRLTPIQERDLTRGRTRVRRRRWPRARRRRGGT
jgi:PhoD-like phosphatase